jgi:hypothetical protein
LREEWFEELYQLGFTEPLFDDHVPENYKSDSWWRDKNL